MPGSATNLLPAGPNASPSTRVGLRTLEVEPGSDLASAIAQLAPTAASPGILRLGGGVYTTDGGTLTLSVAGLTIDGQHSATIDCRIVCANGSDVTLRHVIISSQSATVSTLVGELGSEIVLAGVSILDVAMTANVGACTATDCVLDISGGFKIVGTTTSTTVGLLNIVEDAGTSETTMDDHVTIGHLDNFGGMALSLDGLSQFTSAGKLTLRGNMAMAGTFTTFHVEALTIDQATLAAGTKYPIIPTSATGTIVINHVHIRRAAGAIVPVTGTGSAAFHMGPISTSGGYTLLNMGAFVAGGTLSDVPGEAQS